MKYLLGCCGIFLFVGISFGYLEDKLYCSLQNNAITLSMKKEENNTKCELFLSNINTMAKKLYDEILLVTKYIYKKEDTLYWKDVFEQKKAEFLSLMTVKNQIETTMKEFEDNLFQMYRTSLSVQLSPYLARLTDKYQQSQKLLIYEPNNEILRNRVELLHQQRETVRIILNSQNFETIMNQINTYLYLKKQLTGI